MEPSATAIDEATVLLSLLDFGVPWAVLDDMPTSQLRAYQRAARRLSMQRKLDTFEAMLVAQADPKSRGPIVDKWVEIVNGEDPETPTQQQHSGNGMSIEQFMQFIG